MGKGMSVLPQVNPQEIGTPAQRERWKRVLVALVDSMSDEELERWNEAERPGAMLVLTLACKRKGPGFEVRARSRVDLPMVFT
jgi:hypothetical protein